MQLVMTHITHVLRFVVALRKLNVVAGLGFCGLEKASILAHRWHQTRIRARFNENPKVRIIP